MKEKLIKLLGLNADATDDQVVENVAQLLSEYGKLKSADEQSEVSASREKQIRKKIAESGGALNREQAIMALDHQEEANAKRKPKK